MKPDNSNGNPNQQPNAQAWFCPSCGGADVTASSLSGGDARCNICSWSGRVEDLPTFRFSHDGGTPEEVFQRFFIDVRKLIAQQQFATAIGFLLIKWGFLDQPDPRTAAAFGKVLARYVVEAAKAIVQSIADTRAAIEKEKHGDAAAQPG
jgi:hypothetical protein